MSIRLHKTWLHIKSTCTCNQLTRQIYKLKHAFIFIDRKLMFPLKMPALEFSKRCCTDSSWFLPGSCAFLNIVARCQLYYNMLWWKKCQPFMWFLLTVYLKVFFIDIGSSWNFREWKESGKSFQPTPNH